MTLLYLPVRIETVEQAEALPRKAVILVALKRTGEVHASHLHEDLTPGYWPNRLEEPRRWDWTALVPLEADEHIVSEATFADPDQQLRRFTTPWLRVEPGGAQ